MEPVSAHGRLSNMRLAAVAVAVSLVVVSGCGASGAADDPAEQPSRGSGSGPTELTVVVRTGAGQAERTFSLTCDPPGGDHPDPVAACRLLDRLPDPFAPLPADEACTEIYGGPETATVTGTFRGEPVDAAFSRSNGCQISRWDAYRPLLVERGGAVGS